MLRVRSRSGFSRCPAVPARPSEGIWAPARCRRPAGGRTGGPAWGGARCSVPGSVLCSVPAAGPRGCAATATMVKEQFRESDVAKKM